MTGIVKIEMSRQACSCLSICLSHVANADRDSGLVCKCSFVTKKKSMSGRFLSSLDRTTTGPSTYTSLNSLLPATTQLVKPLKARVVTCALNLRVDSKRDSLITQQLNNVTPARTDLFYLHPVQNRSSPSRAVAFCLVSSSLSVFGYFRRHNRASE
ncbi:hypothetical protein L596_011595 [Steinernema carpocapsae]|uniref:Uncharacterized protein n=1 Tax=Steinernema carpocapsae TaxID=34508 RepID=A0A4U5NVC4_STECR|nr:hypothetical protein L596_011595 [Steinernema carpocapsae]